MNCSSFFLNKFVIRKIYTSFGSLFEYCTALSGKKCTRNSQRRGCVWTSGFNYHLISVDVLNLLWKRLLMTEQYRKIKVKMKIKKWTASDWLFILSLIGFFRLREILRKWSYLYRNCIELHFFWIMSSV